MAINPLCFLFWVGPEGPTPQDFAVADWRAPSHHTHMSPLLSVFTSWRMFLLLLMGISSGLPLALTASTLQAWMTEQGVDLGTIGFFSLVTLPYSLKFVWSPIMDRLVPPFLGRRRGWMLLTQLALVVAILAMGSTDPKTNTALMAALAVLVAFFSASQDIVVDAYRPEILKSEEFGAGAAIAILGHRLGMLSSGAGGLMLAHYLPWPTVYWILAASMVIGVIATLLAKEPVTDAPPPRTLKEAVLDPLRDYFKRSGAFEILLFVILYKLGDVLAAALSTSFMQGLGFSKLDIGAVTKGVGLAATIFGAMLGGAIMAKIGTRRALIWFGVLQCVSNLSFALLASVGKDYTIMTAAILIENLSGGMGTAAFVAFLMGLCNKRFTATQYALLTSLAAVPRSVIAAPAGYLVKALGWEWYFVMCTAAAVPGLLMIRRFRRWG